MTKLLSGFAAGIVVGLVLGGAAVSGRFSAPGLAAEQGEPKSVSKVVLENDRVRVKDVTFPPGVTGMHRHDLPHVGVVIAGGTLEFRYPDGTTETAKLEPGGVGFREAGVSHEPVNRGATPVRVIEVELK